MSLFQSNGALKYGGPIDLRMFAHKASVPDEVAKARGALAHPGVPLADLAHVGEMVKDLGLYAPTKYIDAAFRVLDECPLQDDIVRRPFLESPDSWRYAAHLKALDRATVLGVYGVYDRDLGVILGPRGVVLPGQHPQVLVQRGVQVGAHWPLQVHSVPATLRTGWGASGAQQKQRLFLGVQARDDAEELPRCQAAVGGPLGYLRHARVMHSHLYEPLQLGHAALDVWV